MATTRILYSYITIALLVLALSWSTQAQPRTLNGFDVSDASIPPDEIFQGGPPRDGIPSIDNPDYISPDEADFLRAGDRVMGVEIEGQAYAYPIGIMNYHEIVNHETSDGQILVTYCPLCGTGMVFDGEVAGRNLTFGVSGLLYNSDLLMYDHQTESLWPQIKGKAVSGPMKGENLELMPSMLTDWEHWFDENPDTLVLSRDTGHRRNYDRSPYGDYERSANIFFPVAERDDRYHPKEWIVGLELNGEARAWPFEELERSGRTVIEDELGGEPLEVHFNPDARTAQVFDAEGEEKASTTAFWFAWYAFHPDTSVYTAD